MLPRIKKVIFTPEWKDGRPQRQATAEEVKRSPRIVKYLRLESYEDALDSIEFEPRPPVSCPAKVGSNPSDEYLLKYMLRWETKDSETLLNVAGLTDALSPTGCASTSTENNGSARLTCRRLSTTYLGLNVRTTRGAYDDGGRRYLVYRGETREAPDRKVAVVWRETARLD